MFGLHFEPMCHESHTFGIYVSKETYSTYACTPYTAYTFTQMTLCMLMCTLTYCGRKGHFAKFCYDRINDSNFANKFVSVRKGANLGGPKKVWVPKFIPNSLDVGIGSHTT